MNWLRAIAIGMCGLACAAADMDRAVEDAKSAAELRAREVATRDPADYGVRIENDDNETRYYRRDRLILTRIHRNGIYTLRSAGGVVGHVVVGQETSPRLLLLPNLQLAVGIQTLPDGRQRLDLIDAGRGEFEAYHLSPEEVKPVNAESYLATFIDAEASRTFFDELGKSISEAAENDTP